MDHWSTSDGLQTDNLVVGGVYHGCRTGCASPTLFKPLTASVHWRQFGSNCMRGLWSFGILVLHFYMGFVWAAGSYPAWLVDPVSAAWRLWKEFSRCCRYLEKYRQPLTIALICGYAVVFLLLLLSSSSSSSSLACHSLDPFVSIFSRSSDRLKAALFRPLLGADAIPHFRFFSICGVVGVQRLSCFFCLSLVICSFWWSSSETEQDEPPQTISSSICPSPTFSVFYLWSPLFNKNVYLKP